MEKSSSGTEETEEDTDERKTEKTGSLQCPSHCFTFSSLSYDEAAWQQCLAENERHGETQSRPSTINE